jgi:hypothetical protein
MKTMEKIVGVHFLVHNTSRVKGVCWNFKMRARMTNKQFNYSYKLAQTKQRVG